MRRALAILLFCVISCHCILKVAIVVWYEYNKDYIAQNLCENKDKPQLKCCGKCYLRKQLAKADGRNRAGKALAEQLSKTEIMPFIIPQGLVIGNRFSEIQKQVFYYHHSMPEEVALGIFQPPG